MRRINFRLFFIILLLLAILTFFSFNESFTADEEKLANNNFLHLLSDFFNIMRFPTHILLPELTKPPFYFATGLIVNCLFYSLLIERIVYFIFRRKSEEDDPAQDTPVDL